MVYKCSEITFYTVFLILLILFLMEITNDLLYIGASRILDAWRDWNPKSFHDLSAKLDEEKDGVTVEPAYHDGMSTGIRLSYIYGGLRVLSVVVPQLGIDRTIISTQNSNYGTRKFNIPFCEIPKKLEKIIRDLEEKVNVAENIEEKLEEAA